MSQIDFKDEAAAAFHLLRESTNILSRHGVEFVVVGGWAPYLFNSTQFGHPGTFDVDILLDDSSLEDGTFDRASNAMLEDGYLRAPKNRFQAHRILKAHGEQFVFHVDFLNKRAPDTTLDVVGGKGKLRSIYTDSMKVVFRYGEYRYCRELDGIRFPSPATFIATKAAAVNVSKRQRDAFDVFVTAVDERDAALAEKWRQYQNDGLFVDANTALREAIHARDGVDKIKVVCESTGRRIPSRDEILTVFDFLCD